MAIILASNASASLSAALMASFSTFYAFAVFSASAACESIPSAISALY
jgi:hypothetical protein